MFEKFFITSVLTTALAANASFAKDFNPNRLVVRLNVGHSLPQSDNYTNAKKLIGNLYVLETQNVEALQQELSNSDSVSYTQKDFKAGKRRLAKKEIDLKSFSMMEAPSFDAVLNDSRINRQWSFKDAKKHGASITKSYEQAVSQSREEIIVAIIDTGIDYNHEDIKDVVWTNENEIPGNGIDDDNNGYIDDVHGISTLERDKQGNALGDNMDGHNHGTHVAGIIGAKQNNRTGIAGIASNVKLMAIRTIPNHGNELDIDVMESMIYAANNGAKIINCSFGKYKLDEGLAVSEVIKEISEQFGVLVIIASGNETVDIDTNLVFPASFDNESTLVVGSTNRRGRVSRFSNYGKNNVDVVAPGSAIYSTVPGNRYASYSGTSMAAPVVSGVAAEVLSHNPHLTNLELKKVLMDSSVKKTKYASKSLSGGRIDLYSALTMALTY